MNLTIGSTEYTMYFGLDFIAYLDQIYYFEGKDNVKLGNGISMVVANIKMENPVVLLHLIRAATITDKSKPSTEDIKKYLETEADYEALFSDFLSSLETAYVTSRTMKKLVELNGAPILPKKKASK